jgi:hypothetical protein
VSRNAFRRVEAAMVLDRRVALTAGTQGYLQKQPRPEMRCLSGRLPKSSVGRSPRLASSSSQSDANCFGVTFQFADRDYYGLDSEPSFLPL